MEIKHFVTFYMYEGNGYREITKEIKSKELLNINVPEKAVGFMIYDSFSEDLKQHGQIVATPKDRFNEEIYYIGTIISVDDLKKDYGENSTTYKSIIEGGYYRAIKTINGTLVPLKLNEKINIISPNELGEVCGIDYEDEENTNS